MTAREALARERRRLMAQCGVWFGAFPVCWMLSEVFALPVLFFAGIAACLAGIVTLLYAHIAGLRCPRCRGRLGALLFQMPGWSVAERLTYCPYCGAALDTDIDHTTAAESDTDCLRAL
jgi:hypothetical protein